MKTEQFAEVALEDVPLGVLFRLGFVVNIFFWTLNALLMLLNSLFGGQLSIPYAEAAAGFVGGFIGPFLFALFMSLLGAAIFWLGCVLVRWLARGAKFSRLVYRMSDRQMRNEELLRKVRAAQKQVREEKAP